MFRPARDKARRKRWGVLAFLVCSGWLAFGGAACTTAGEKTDQGSKGYLKPDTLAELHALVRPHTAEWRHLEVNWLTDVVAARQRAAAEDKPIVINYTGGAGYNEPLGVC